MAGGAGLNPFRTLVVHRNFRRFWIGQTVSLVGTWMQQVAQGWLALQLTDDPFYVGLVAAAGSFPVLLLSLPAGVLADRVSKLALVRTAQALLLVQATTLWWFVWSGHIGIGSLLALALAQGALAAVEIPARQALIVELVGREDLLDAIALNSSGFNLARIVGPSIAAVVIAQAGIAWAFGLNALSYLAVLLGLALVHLPPRARPAAVLRPVEGIRDGLRYIRSTPEVSALVRLAAVFSVLGVPYITLMPVFARDVLGLGASGYGTLLSSVGVGALVGALGLAATGRRIARGRLLRASTHLFAGCLLLLAFVRVPWLAGVVLFAAGLTMILSNATTNGLLQTIAPDEYRGRVMSVYSLVFVGFSPIGSFVAGAAARVIGVDGVIGVGAVVMLAYAAWAFGRRPVLKEL